jgi:uncharacterized protein YjbI with pentapeptide repeats
MLKDAELRKKTMGGKVLMVQGIAIDGGAFDHVEWENIHFKDVDFNERFEQKSLKDVIFEDCEFQACGFFAHDMKNVTFVNCKTRGQAYIMSQGKCENVVFENCDFTDQPDAEPNNWGAVTIGGEVTYKNCKAKHIDVSGYDKTRYEGCTFEDMKLTCGSGTAKRFADVTIEGCTFKKEIDMVTANVASLTVKNSTFETFLTTDTVRDSIFVENMKANYFWIHAYEYLLKSITVKNCEFHGTKNKDPVFRIYKKGDNPVKTENLIVEDIKYVLNGRDDGSDIYQSGKNTHFKNIEMPKIGFDLRGETFQMTNINTKVAFFETRSEQTPNVTLTNMNIAERFKFEGVKLPSLVIDGYKGDTLSLKDAKIGRLEIKNARVETLLDLTNAQVGSGEFSTLSGSKKIKVITKGSNLDVKDGTLYVVPPKKG